ncbi:MAG: hypothetical protein JKY42_11330, partial [Flavobacteriales bacterium]|nr:hypothetical protein [Flavobacteriales bacterium]
LNSTLKQSLICIYTDGYINYKMVNGPSANLSKFLLFFRAYISHLAHICTLFYYVIICPSYSQGSVKSNCGAQATRTKSNAKVGALFLCGGWVEALYFTTVVAQNDGAQSVKTRIAEQKGSLENLIKLLQRHAETEEVADFVSELIELYYLFDEIESTYVWKEPTTNEATKTTIINSVTEASAIKEQLTAIAAKVESIRNHIIG